MKKVTINITNLRLRTIIGFHDIERIEKQDIIINIKYVVEASKAIETDSSEYITDYKKLTKKIIERVEKTEFYLLEKLTDYIHSIVINEPNILSATVKVDKPYALRFADSVSVEINS